MSLTKSEENAHGAANDSSAAVDEAVGAAVGIAGDLIAGAITSLLLIPQAVAYALLAGLPAWCGLYAAVIPVIVYAATGTSKTLSVGPVAVAAIMVNEALRGLGASTEAELVAAAASLSLMVGVALLLLSLLRGGALVRFISQPVLSGFVTGAALLIIFSQIATVLGLPLADLFAQASGELGVPNRIDHAGLVLGIGGIVLLLAARAPLSTLLDKAGVPTSAALLISRIMPALLVVLSTILVWHGGYFETAATVGAVQGGFARFNVSVPDFATLQALFIPAMMIATIGYVESVSVAKTLASRRRERIDPNIEMRALGWANIAASLVSTMPVAGGFSRSVVNFEAGARTQWASVVAALLVAVAAMTLGATFAWMPKAILAAIIIVAVAKLIEWRELIQLLRQTPADALVFIATTAGVLVFGVEIGLIVGVIISMGQLVLRSSQPHIAVVGRIAGSEHFRNVCRHTVETRSGLLMIRIDENLIFTNAEAVGQFVRDATFKSEAHQVVLIMTSVSHIDATGQHMLSDLHESMERSGITLQLAEVKGPVMDSLANTSLHEKFKDAIFLSANCVFETFANDRANDSNPCGVLT